MQSVSNAFLAAMTAPVIQSKISGTVDGTSFDDDDILAGSLRLTAQNSSQDEINIGTAVSAGLEVTFLHSLGLTRTTLQGKTITLSYMLKVGSSYESLTIGTFYISEANWTLKGIQCRAFDAMTKFDTDILTTETLPSSGKAYDFLTWVCTACSVTLGMTQEQIEALTNGSVTIAYPADNPCKTHREYLAYIAAVLCGFAVINRSGQLVICQYSTTSCATYTTTERITGASFSDFTTRYNGFYVTDMESNASILYKNSGYTGLVMDLGANPFIQSEPSRTTITTALLSRIADIAFVPFDVKLNIPPVHDLGDCVSFTGGIGDTENHTVNYMFWNYHKQIELTGYGKNPATAAAMSKTDQNLNSTNAAIRSLTQRINSVGSMVFIVPIETSTSAIADGDAAEVQIYAFEVTGSDNVPVAFHSMIEVTVNTTYIQDEEYDDCTITSKIYFDGEEVSALTWEEVCSDGKRILNADILLTAVEPGTHSLSLELSPTGGSIS